METSWSSQDIKSATQGEVIWKANEVHAQIQHLMSKLNKCGTEYNEKNLFNCLFYITNTTETWWTTGILKSPINRKDKRGSKGTGYLKKNQTHAIIPFRVTRNTGSQLLNT